MANVEKSKVTADDIESLIEIFKQSGWDEMHLEAEGLELFLSNDPNAQGPRQTAAPAAPSSSAAPPAPAPAALPAIASSVVPAGMIAIRAPNLGTFYRSPKPGAPPYVDLGQQIDLSTEVCLIEVMKLFTPVQGGVRGIVREIRATDGQMVEFDDLLIVVEPN